MLCGLFSSCGNWGLLSDWSVQAPHCGGFLLLWSTGSIVVAHRLSCSATWGIFPNQGSNPCLLHWQAEPLPLSHQGSPTVVGLKSFPGLHMSPHLPPPAPSHASRMSMADSCCVWQKPTQYCKVIILQLKIEQLKKKKSFPGNSDTKPGLIWSNTVPGDSLVVNSQTRN